MFSTDTFNYFKEELKNTTSNYLEIGVYNGGSISELGKLYPTKTIFAIDPFIEDGNTSHNSRAERYEPLKTQREQTHSRIKGLKNVILYEMLSSDFFKTLDSTTILDMNVGAVYIDGSHHYDDVTNDYKLAMSLLSDKGGYICIDDLQVPDVQLATDKFCRKMKYRIKSHIDINKVTKLFIINPST